MNALILKVKTFIVEPVVGFMFILATAYFLWGVVQYFLYQNSDDARAQGQKHMMWGIIGMFIMVSFWGIIRIIAGTTGATVTNPLPGWSPPTL